MPLRLSREAREVLLSYHWPGNIRQLEQAIFAAVAICEGSEIGPAEFPGWLHHALKPGMETSAATPAGESAFHRPAVSTQNAASFNEERARYLEVLHQAGQVEIKKFMY